MGISLRVLQHWSEQRQELSARPVQSGFDGADRNALSPSERLHRLLVNLGEEKHSPLLVGKAADRRLEGVAQLLLLDELVGAGSRIGDLRGVLDRHEP